MTEPSTGARTDPAGGDPVGANTVRLPDGTRTWAELTAEGRAMGLGHGPVVVLAGSATEAVRAVAAHRASVLDGHPGELVITTTSRVDDTMRTELADAGFAIWQAGALTESPAPRPVQPGRIWLLTSGSTGRPKRIGHTLDTLTTVRGQTEPRTWLCPYLPGTYAWWQVITLGLSGPGQELCVLEPSELDAWPAIAAEVGVTAASGTPTFWRQTLFRDPETLRTVPLAQITLGGEPVDQAVLDQLHEVFPAARVSWIYASSELGASIVVHDGRAGFPRAWLDRHTDGRPELFVEGDELLIASPHHGEGADGNRLTGAVRTGDRVEVTDDRVFITGRLDSDEINVGGSKVSAGRVRDVLLSHPGVAWARVFGRKAPLVGRMVAAEVVPAPGASDLTDAALVAWCTDRLPEYGVPRRIRMLTEIPVKETLKSDV